MSRRVVITGLGIVSPIGVGVDRAWDAAINGRSGIARMVGLDNLEDYRSQIVGQVKDFDPTEYMSPKTAKRADKFCQYALAAARMAVDDSGLEIDESLSERVGVIMGCGLGGLPVIEEQYTVLGEKGPGRVSPFFIPMVCPNMAGGLIAIEHNAKGPNTLLATACAAGNHGIGEAMKTIQRGAAEVVISGGVEAVIGRCALAGFASMKALSTRNDDPEHASRPFDADRDGFVAAEGGGILILEELERAKKRGAKIYAELVGYGLTADAHHMTAPSPSGEGAVRCMQTALDDAGIDLDQVDYINAHGTSTPLNDAAESRAIRTLFGDWADKLAVSSTKSMTGHALGGAGGLEGVFLAKTIETGIVPPTMNYETPDPDCDLDYVPNQAREAKPKVCLSNAFGFGGTNAAIVMKKFEG